MKTSKRCEEDLYRRVAEIIDAARGHVALILIMNSVVVHACWLIGRQIAEADQHKKNPVSEALQARYLVFSQASSDRSIAAAKAAASSIQPSSSKRRP